MGLRLRIALLMVLAAAAAFAGGEAWRSLRAADRAMVKAGIPVLSRQELLSLLEDLGS